jgi:fructose-1,6-bisphosphatase class II
VDRNLALEVVRVTEAAALAAGRFVGLGYKDGADRAAVEAMRRTFSYLHIRGRVVIGEGERDEAPMLYIGEELGDGSPDAPEIDIAVDPLEGTNLCANGINDALAVVAMAEHGQFLNAPDTYMNKIAVGGVARGAHDHPRSATHNLAAIAEAKRVRVADLTAVILDRPRHDALVAEVRRAGVRIRLISDGDVGGAMATADAATGIDVLLGVGGAPEGVLAAAALRCMGGDMQGVLNFRNNEERERAARMGIKDHGHVFSINELASGDVMFAATGVTDGFLLRGVRYTPTGAETSSIVMRSRSMSTRHHFEEHPIYDRGGQPR